MRVFASSCRLALPCASRVAGKGEGERRRWGVVLFANPEEKGLVSNMEVVYYHLAINGLQCITRNIRCIPGIFYQAVITVDILSWKA